MAPSQSRLEQHVRSAPSTEDSVNWRYHATADWPSQFKRTEWKKVVDIIPSNFLQTRMLSYDRDSWRSLASIADLLPAKEKAPAWGRPGLNGRKAEHRGVRGTFHPNSR